MKKKRLFEWGRGILLLAFWTQVLAWPLPAVAQQEERFTLNLKNASLKEIINEIKRLSDYDFAYSDADLVAVKPRDVIAREKTLNEILSTCLQGTGLTYTVNNHAIIIRKDAAPRDQQKTRAITGAVTDTRGEPLPGVTVRLKGTMTGATTGGDGHYHLNVPDDEGAILVFSFVGMIPREVAIGARTSINVKLEEETMLIDEVVVTGYFERSKNTFTGAFNTVKREELRKFGNASLLSALQLIDPSFKIREDNDRGSDPNRLPDFFVRGESSFMGNSNIPTFIVDGHEVTLQQVFDMDLDRIESLSILKDASATIHYGSRAANGVVVIETRRPAGGKFAVSYTNRTSLSAADLSGYNLLNAREKLDYELAAGLFTSADPTTQHGLDQQLEYYKRNLAKGVNTDWLAQPTRSALSHSHALYIEGGTDAVTYGLGGNYAKNAGVIKQSFRENLGLTFDFTYRVAGKATIRNSFSYGQTNVQNSPYGSFSTYARANPYNPVRDEAGKLVKSYPAHYSRESTEEQYANPLYNASLPYKDGNRIVTISDNLSVDYFILPKLRYKGAIALTQTTEEGDKYVSPDHTGFRAETDPLKRGRYTVTSGSTFSYNVNSTLSYSMEINKHLLYSGVGLNVSENRSRSRSLAGVGFLDERFNEIGFAMAYPEGGRPNGVEGKDRLVGILGNINYSYANRYFVDLSGRLDGSSKYGKDRRFAPLWSAGIGWNINNEKFFPRDSKFDRLTLRASIGVTGNQQFDPYVAKTMLQYSAANSYYQTPGAFFLGYGNKRLEWQQSLKRNIGVDVEILERRLTLRLEYYNEITDGLLLPVSVPPSLGFKSYTENFGEQSNRGYEFDLGVVIIRDRDLDWAVNVSGTHNRNRVEKISNALAALNTAAHVGASAATLARPVAMYEAGESLSAIKAVRSLGINPASGKELFLTRAGAVTETWDYRDKIVAGDSKPKLEGNIATNLIVKQFSLNAILRYGFGGQLYNYTLSERVEGSSPYVNADKRVLNERWRKPGDYSFYKNIADRSLSMASSRFVQDNNYLELGNISLGYRVNPELLRRYGISSARVGLNAANLFYLSTVKRERGIDYPFARQFTFSLNLNF
ncbi:MAG: SusC/RagA family TonB-linked outer membrane protein [Odoribacteraceae bacterium]|jgi:TonB-linked SusC/RagA family outer membrane protein|nr:SusC/RagA family TonB-linked outer membrane protein [Odoribacteraceae bacterium]